MKKYSDAEILASALSTALTEKRLRDEAQARLRKSAAPPALRAMPGVSNASPGWTYNLPVDVAAAMEAVKSIRRKSAAPVAPFALVRV